MLVRAIPVLPRFPARGPRWTEAIGERVASPVHLWRRSPPPFSVERGLRPITRPRVSAVVPPEVSSPSEDLGGGAPSGRCRRYALPMMSPEDAWTIFGRHLIRYRDPGLTVSAGVADGWFAVLTEIPDIELNVCALFPPAGRAEASELVARIDAVDTPALVFVSRSMDETVRSALGDRGFRPTTTPEPLMWRSGSSALVPKAASGFTVRRVIEAADLVGLEVILAAAIMMPPEIARRQFALGRLVGDGLGSWVAWDDDQPVRAVTLSWDAQACAVWEMMTMPAHRRRGAGRAALIAALNDVLRPSMTGSVLVSTPLGRALYESLGFVAFDESITWTRGASAEDLARVGQTSATSP